MILSRNSVASPWVERELEIALAKEIGGKTVGVLPLLIEDCEIPGFLSGKLYPDFREKSRYRSEFEKLCRKLRLDKAEEPMVLEHAACEIYDFARARGLEVHDVEVAPISLFGTSSFRARIKDGKGVIYCHASGARRNELFLVRRGIGWFYETVLGGSESELGLPVSNEELVDQPEYSGGFPTSFFEGGFITWSPETSQVRAVLATAEGDRVIAQQKL